PAPAVGAPRHHSPSSPAVASRVVATFFSPSRALMARMKYLEKFLLISVLFVIPLGTVLYAYVTDANTQIDFTRAEQAGTRYLRPVYALSADVLQARSLARQPQTPGLAAEQAAIRADFERLAAVDADLGNDLKTADAFAALKKDLPAVESGVPEDAAFA